MGDPSFFKIIGMRFARFRIFCSSDRIRIARIRDKMMWDSSECRPIVSFDPNF